MKNTVIINEQNIAKIWYRRINNTDNDFAMTVMYMN